MRKVLGLVLSLIFVFSLAFLSINKAKATIVTDANLTVEGASIRTAGNQGMRFTANIGSFAGAVSKYGICLVAGDEAIDDNFVIGGTVNGKSVINAEVNELDGSGKFHVVLWNIPAEAYTMNVSARAYVRLTDDSIVYGAEKQVRNVWTVAAKANSAGISSTLIDDVVNYISDNYMVKTVTSTNQFVISYVNDMNYVYTDETSLTEMLEELWADFIFDFNAANSTSLDASTVTSSAFWSAMYAGISSTSLLTMPSDCNAVKFFSGVNMVKWGWLLEFFTTHGTIHVKNQAEALLRIDRTCQKLSGSTRLPCHQLKHLTGAIWNLFHKSYIMISGMDNYDMSTYSKYSDVPFPTVTDINGSNIVVVGSKVALPNTVRVGYTLDDYQKVGGSTYAVGDEYDVATIQAEFTPNYSTIDYSITYNSNGGTNNPLNPDEYNIETETISLSDATKVGFNFGGWYDNSALTGTPVTTIAKGTTGNIVLYAKWVSSNLDINSYNSANKDILDTTTPDIIVVSDIVSGSYKIINTTNDDFDSKEYAFGTNLFNTVSAAVAAADEYDVIYVFTGVYSDNFTISTDRLTILGADKGATFVHTDSYTTGASHTKISGVVTIGANHTIIQGVEISNQILFANGKTDTLLKEIILTSTSNEPIDVPAGYSTTNLTIDKLVSAGNSARKIYIYGSATNLTVRNCVCLDGVTGLYEFVRVGSASAGRLYGTVIFENNYIQNAAQCALMDRYPTADEYHITGNYFKSCKGPLFFRAADGAKAGAVYNIKYNTFNGCGQTDWDVIGIYITQDKVVNINYNTFLGTLASGADYAINLKFSTGTIDCSNNYFKESADNHTNNATGLSVWDISGCSLTTPNSYELYQVVKISEDYYVNLYDPAA